uniref:Uncharacterized protein n=1 Tax=Mesocestoides corti TaxID=53468 RepID=A0A5K3G3X6_MESCO
MKIGCRKSETQQLTVQPTAHGTTENRYIRHRSAFLIPCYSSSANRATHKRHCRKYPKMLAVLVVAESI